MTPAEHRAKLGLSVAAMAQMVGVTRAGWYKAEKTGVVSEPLARLLAYIERYGVGLAKEMIIRDSGRLAEPPPSRNPERDRSASTDMEERDGNSRAD